MVKKIKEAKGDSIDPPIPAAAAATITATGASSSKPGLDPESTPLETEDDLMVLLKQTETPAGMHTPEFASFPDTAVPYQHDWTDAVAQDLGGFSFDYGKQKLVYSEQIGKPDLKLPPCQPPSTGVLRLLARPLPVRPPSARRIVVGADMNRVDHPCYMCGVLVAGEYTDLMCSRCAALNAVKKEQWVDLQGKIALITGVRVGAGYAAALKLLRCGATVVGLTRFPEIARDQFSKGKPLLLLLLHHHHHHLEILICVVCCAGVRERLRCLAALFVSIRHGSAQLSRAE